jgi:hypothetical protein
MAGDSFGRALGAVIAEIRLQVKDHNEKHRGQFYLDPEDPEAGCAFDVKSTVFPLAMLSLFRPRGNSFEFSVDRTEASFAPRKEAHGRIDAKPDSKGNVPMVAQDGELLPTPSHVARYLLEPIFRDR